MIKDAAKKGRAGILYRAKAPKFHVENPTAKEKKMEKIRLINKKESADIALIKTNGPTLRNI
jgi:hypothetical protein